MSAAFGSASHWAAGGEGVPAQPGLSLIRALQFGDSLLPVGGFAFSAGLESAIQTGVVSDVHTLEEFTRTALQEAALGDGIGLIWAHRAASAGDLAWLARVDEAVHARKLASEARTMSLRMGRKLTELGAAVIDAPLLIAWRERVAAGTAFSCYPVALGSVFAAQGLPARDAFAVHQYGVAAMLLGAALRLMRIDHIATQRLLYRLNSDVDAAYTHAADARLEDMAGFAPLTEVLAAVHVKASVRLFMS
ncbi:MAG: urease accessory protein UreF [Thiohalocapsa sp.]|uniref:urease accessory protein UreF n=1 Tax=Thiohalocapsa sp. TaxID=2497641 RepID=UPI0025FAD8B7|nr:urease accessory protein UreF [Thiohalocapsa sp.]MCG6942627.1 urease accessory protein UreF [Thiohalocapsa sp.]